MQIREVYPGSAAEPRRRVRRAADVGSRARTSSAATSSRTYNATGALVDSNHLPADVADGANQSTFLIATPRGRSAVRDHRRRRSAPPSPLDPAGGAVCWEDLDCVAWGSFSGTPPAPGRHAGRRRSPTAWRCGGRSRRAARPCSSPNDDRDNSAADFEAVFPAPRPNSVAPTEHACAGGGGRRWRRRRQRRPADDAEGASRRRRPRPHPDLPLRLRRRRRDLPMQARRQALQGLPLALHDPQARLRHAHLQGPRHARRRRPRRPLAGVATPSGSSRSAASAHVRASGR